MNKLNSIKKTTLHNELLRTRRELSVLYEISQAMRTTLDLDHILYIILTGVTSHTSLGFNRAVLFLTNPTKRCLEAKMAIGPESLEHAQDIWKHISENKHNMEDLIKEENIKNNSTAHNGLLKSFKNLRIPLKTDPDNLLLAAYHTGLPQHIKQPEISEYANDPLFKVFKTDELVIMPLKTKNHVNGLIIADNLYTKKPICDDDLKIFLMLANQASLAIANSRLYEMIKQKSHTDANTNLWNHGFFQDKLTEEINKTRTTENKVGLIIADLDNFKKLNDTYGHQYGDLILKETAKIFKKSSRNGDYSCRYGGEEFSVILPQTNKEQAFSIAERIRKNIEHHRFPSPHSAEQIKITISIGLSIFPDDAKNKKDLIAEADSAMYKAKFSGKNQTYIS